ncbi:MAG: lytic transglycosylase domain-containing protein [Trichlorobacter sp.]|uniref:lytic transglycosylase domain-containing protein n=1 Tax=Trichlorobacter sp. TaxID=2911007 RepID=UPI002569EEF9|nr:lytic transglycosylase domain-containing protein [Trichlorobacter sp.]MDK9717843.1 lytic transglycosylase domain-containing protein [Trichlorobacter sp.]
MSINAAQTMSLLQSMLREQSRPAAEQAVTTVSSRFSDRLDAVIDRSMVPAEASSEAVQNAAELLQLTSLRSSLELLDDHPNSDGGMALPLSTLPSSSPSLASSPINAYLSNLADSTAPRTTSGAKQPLPALEEPGPKAPEQVERRSSRLSDDLPSGTIEQTIAKASQRYGVDAGLIKAVIKAESNFNPRAVSHAGAQGLMQLMPATARGLGVSNSFDPEQNVMAGTRFLKGLLDRYSGDLDSALAAYNWGPGNVDRKPDRLPRETREYLVKVKQYYSAFTA